MAEVTSIALGLAIQARTEGGRLARKEDRTRLEVDQNRQAQVARQELAAEEQAQARQRRAQTVDEARRALQADLTLFAAQRETQDVLLADRRFEILQDEISDEILSARARDDQPEPLEPLAARESVGTVLSADDIEARDRLNSVPEPIPVPTPADDRPFAPGPAPVETTVAGVQPLDGGLQSAEAQAIADDVAFDQLEGERAVRLTDRRDDDRDSTIQQQIDQQISEDRIAEIPPDPNLPRGSIVDISG